jgi:hypothetical protein
MISTVWLSVTRGWNRSGLKRTSNSLSFTDPIERHADWIISRLLSSTKI